MQDKKGIRSMLRVCSSSILRCFGSEGEKKLETRRLTGGRNTHRAKGTNDRQNGLLLGEREKSSLSIVRCRLCVLANVEGIDETERARE